jgi:succinate dehydrogenase / fumarate reductase cytochrome b subunit
MPSDIKPTFTRPTSPHLGIYRWQISSVLSIFHRMSGIALFAGTFLLVTWLWSAAYAPRFYITLHDAMVSPLGQACLMAWTAAFFYHLGNGVRHLFWDIARSGWAVILFTILMTAFTWGYIYASAGALI